MRTEEMQERIRAKPQAPVKVCQRSSAFRPLARTWMTVLSLRNHVDHSHRPCLVAAAVISDRDEFAQDMNAAQDLGLAVDGVTQASLTSDA